MGEILTIFVNSPPLDSKMRRNKIGYRIGYFPCVIRLLNTVQSWRKTVSALEVQTGRDFPALSSRTFPLYSLNSSLMALLTPVYIHWYDVKVRETGPNTCRDLWTGNPPSTHLQAGLTCTEHGEGTKWSNNHGEGDNKLLQ